MKNELREICHSQKKEKQIEHALNQNNIVIKSKNVISLTATSDTENLQYTDREDTNLYNILIACLFEHIYLLFEHNTLSICVKGIQLYKRIC